MIIIHLSKQQTFYADPKALQKNNFTGNMHGANNRVMFLIIEDAKETILHFSLGTMKVLQLYFVLT